VAVADGVWVGVLVGTGVGVSVGIGVAVGVGMALGVGLTSTKTCASQVAEINNKDVSEQSRGVR
jgi:hypothetical protein